MNFELIRNFVTVAKTKNITRSAEILYVAQSTVSYRLKALEIEVGTELVLRKRGIKSTELTERGQAFLPIAERWLSLWHDTNIFKAGEKGRKLVVGCVNSIATCLLADFFASMIAKHPEIRLQVIIMDSDIMYEKLKSREIDIGIVLFNLFYKNITVRKLFEEKMYCVGNFEDKSKLKTIKIGELQSCNEVLLNWGYYFEMWHNLYFKEIVNPKMQVNTIFLMGKAIQNGNAWSIVPETVANYFIKHKVCRRYNLDVLPPDRVTYTITRSVMEPDLEIIINQFISDVKIFINSYKNKNRLKSSNS